MCFIYYSQIILKLIFEIPRQSACYNGNSSAVIFLVSLDDVFHLLLMFHIKMFSTLSKMQRTFNLILLFHILILIALNNLNNEHIEFYILIIFF